MEKQNRPFQAQRTGQFVDIIRICQIKGLSKSKSQYISKLLLNINNNNKKERPCPLPYNMTDMQETRLTMKLQKYEFKW